MKKTTQLSVYLLSTKPQGVFIGTRGKGAQVANPGPKYRRGHARTAAETRPRPRFHGSSRAARGACCRALSRLSPIGCRSRYLVLGPWF